MIGPAPKPCPSCPYRRDVPSGVWSVEEYRKLCEYDAPTHDQPLGVFQCHQVGRDDPRAQPCAGWVAVHGSELLALRIAVSTGRLDPDVMDYTTPVPLFPSGAAAARHGLRDIEHPGPAARRLIAKITRQRDDVSSE